MCMQVMRDCYVVVDIYSHEGIALSVMTDALPENSIFVWNKIPVIILTNEIKVFPSCST